MEDALAGQMIPAQSPDECAGMGKSPKPGPSSGAGRVQLRRSMMVGGS
jgi:hypothetical protein